MLVLSRHEEEKIFIGDDIVITVCRIRPDKVRLGIAAPRAIPVHRQEIYEAIQKLRNTDGERTGPTEGAGEMTAMKGA